MAEGREAPDGLVTLADIRAAAHRIKGVALETPLLPFPELSEELGGEVRLKCESLQRTGAFKIRGAHNFLSQLPEEDLAAGVITYSSGNHAQATALAAALRGVRAVVVMPTTAPSVKVEGAKRLGAEVYFEGTLSHQRQARAEEMAKEQGLTIVPPYDHPWIIAGQGTVGLEIVAQWPEVDTVLVPVGGGGLSSGTSAAVKALLPEVRFVGVEPEGAPRMTEALKAGKPVTLEQVDTVADGLRTVRAGDHTFRHAQRFFDEVVTVPDEAMIRAAALLLTRRRLVVEVSGAIAVGALLAGVVEPMGERMAVVLSGGNLDPALMESLAQGGSVGLPA